MGGSYPPKRRRHSRSRSRSPVRHNRRDKPRSDDHHRRRSPSPVQKRSHSYSRADDDRNPRHEDDRRRPSSSSSRKSRADSVATVSSTSSSSESDSSRGNRNSHSHTPTRKHHTKDHHKEEGEHKDGKYRPSRHDKEKEKSKSSKKKKEKHKSRHHKEKKHHHHHHHPISATGILSLVESELTKTPLAPAASLKPSSSELNNHGLEAVHHSTRDVKDGERGRTAAHGKGRRPVAAPQTQAEYEKEQSHVREVFDPLSGRTSCPFVALSFLLRHILVRLHSPLVFPFPLILSFWRLVKGSGEIIERIVSRDEHLAINRTATQTDGSLYARVLGQGGS
ncbi:uncharacterized protein EV422DRAFT_341142 [Fimicolochytrium jonesii]|uniref:uncharacterized protein n=1 Tax=Fimicolochytrium jonesii TaxID=1396493 RepID=UPI0022FDC9F4|nr:uncharacterized protein EV422DRAFT_341142 [Fimicolochytrium jonesii]KAI8815804.1 hypothetical protein EV422DRAFT_341142 [Fimicolochytrium jonesii]